MNIPNPEDSAMLDEAISLEAHAVRRFGDSDASELQTLFERCSDYVEIYSGVSPHPSEGAEELRALPPDNELADKFSFGIFSAQQQLVGYIDLMRDYPAEREWWIGLLMIHPRA